MSTEQTVKGLDTTQSCIHKVDNLHKQGYAFVGRYYNVNRPEKNLTLEEAEVLSRGGIKIVAVWENGYPTKSVYFTELSGGEDTESAYDYARNVIRQPMGSAIYFTIDYDASAADLGHGIHQYMQNLVSTLKARGDAYKIGIYGSGLTCEYAIQHIHGIHYTWLAESSGWTHSRTFTGWNIRQTGSGSFHGLSIDLDEAVGSYGSFGIPL
ncbi:glycoside hydrolase domain-containing protein [Paenibacillus shenyangensis]|uniref:glycoside hydrolase domain-containing protein n=1 Tax=Paenibacillus sp. A9 TaxID=1284352 RepID=UPI000374C4F7|nr:glycoside hydrolase domain-containing protein [Paenibacillus sp. A9]